MALLVTLVGCKLSYLVMGLPVTLLGCELSHPSSLLGLGFCWPMDCLTHFLHWVLLPTLLDLNVVHAHSFSFLPRTLTYSSHCGHMFDMVKALCAGCCCGGSR
jgi:hypothetical protein